MSKFIQSVRGTHDIFGEAMSFHQHIIDVSRNVCKFYGACEISTPIFEFSEVFHRTLGESSDVVSKETYSFTDRSGESITLRPEFTAAIVRAFLSGGYTQQLPFKVFYQGPAFRYERPQKGRQRQFHQVGLEVLGADNPLDDVEVIAQAAEIADKLGLKDSARLEINSIGDTESRNQYRETLVEYLEKYKNDLSEESKIRLDKNPLRILDSKQKEDQEIIKDAPKLFDSFTDNAKSWFDQVREGLEVLGLEYHLSNRLVRGLDYYTHTVFEFTTDMLGSQATFIAGGRYDGLVAQMGGPEISGVGWAGGIERLVLMMQELGLKDELSESSPVILIPLGDEENKVALELGFNIRRANIKAEILYKGNMAKRIKKADKAGAYHAIIIGEEERLAGNVVIKNMTSGEQNITKISEVINVIGR